MRVFIENPFERSGQTKALDAIKEAMARETDHPTSQLRNPKVLAEIARDYWSGPPQLLRHRFEHLRLQQGEHLLPGIDGPILGFQVDGEGHAGLGRELE